MIERIQKAATGQDKPDPIARLAILVVPFLLTVALGLGAVVASDIKQSIERNRVDVSQVGELISTIQQGFAIQEQILSTVMDDNQDHEGRIRALERWQNFVNSGPASPG